MFENMRLGSELTESEQRYVLATFIHRYTRDHTPTWAREKRPDGSKYQVQFSSDFDWLTHTRFAVTKTGNLNRKARECFSTPTWPDGNPFIEN